MISVTTKTRPFTFLVCYSNIGYILVKFWLYLFIKLCKFCGFLEILSMLGYRYCEAHLWFVVYFRWFVNARTFRRCICPFLWLQRWLINDLYIICISVSNWARKHHIRNCKKKLSFFTVPIIAKQMQKNQYCYRDINA